MLRSKLRESRIQHKYTPDELARLLGISKRMLYYIEQGTRNPSLEVANKLEDLLEIPQRELLVQDYTPETVTEGSHSK